MKPLCLLDGPVTATAATSLQQEMWNMKGSDGQQDLRLLCPSAAPGFMALGCVAKVDDARLPHKSVYFVARYLSSSTGDYNDKEAAWKTTEVLPSTRPVLE